MNEPVVTDGTKKQAGWRDDRPLLNAKRTVFMGADFSQQRKELVQYLCQHGYIKTASGRQAFLSVQRELFVGDQQIEAYQDTPLPIGWGQTISAPHMVAVMTELCEPERNDAILEIGAGSGYQAAILGKLAKKVIAMEIIPELCSFAKANLKKAGIKNVQVMCGGLDAIPKQAYNTVLFSCAAPSFPKKTLRFLKEGGRLVVPVGRGEAQQVVRWRGGRLERHGWCSFVPLQERQ